MVTQPVPPKQTTSELNLTPTCVGCQSTRAIRIHYGAPSCHGCKAFFRRSHFEARRYVCGGNNNCDTTDEARNRCRACRLRRCIEGGMRSSLMREERSRVPRIDGPRIDSTSGSDRETPAPNEEQAMTQFLIRLEQRVERLTDADVIDDDQNAWFRNDVSIAMGLHNPSLVCKRYTMDWSCKKIMNSNDMYSAWYRSFVLLADWATGIEQFRNLPLGDKAHLFKTNFMSFGWLTYCYQCYVNRYEDLGMPLGNGSYIPCRSRDLNCMELRWAQTYGTLCRNLIRLIVCEMAKMGMTYEEFVIIKAICLFQKDGSEAETTQMVCDSMRDHLLEALTTHMAVHFSHLPFSQRTMRASKAMLLLSSLSYCGRMESNMISQLTSVDRHELSGIPREILNGTAKSEVPFW